MKGLVTLVGSGLNYNDRVALAMNSFQQGLWGQCSAALLAYGVRCEGPQRVDGKSETYFVASFSVRGRDAELFLYEDEAGVMLDGDDWTIHERPDYESQDDLMKGFLVYFNSLLSGSNTQET